MLHQLLNLTPLNTEAAGRLGQLSLSYLIEDLSSFLCLFHLHGAVGNPWRSLNVVVVVRLVVIL